MFASFPLVVCRYAGDVTVTHRASRVVGPRISLRRRLKTSMRWRGAAAALRGVTVSLLSACALVACGSASSSGPAPAGTYRVPVVRLGPGVAVGPSGYRMVRGAVVTVRWRRAGQVLLSNGKRKSARGANCEPTKAITAATQTAAQAVKASAGFASFSKGTPRRTVAAKGALHVLVAGRRVTATYEQFSALTITHLPLVPSMKPILEPATTLLSFPAAVPGGVVTVTLVFSVQGIGCTAPTPTAARSDQLTAAATVTESG